MEKRISDLVLTDVSSTVVDLRAPVYWDAPFESLCEAKDLVEFYIIDVQPEHGGQSTKYQLATIECARSSDMSRTYIVRSHLGRILNPGDHAMGYDLTHANFNNDAWDVLNSGKLRSMVPDVVLVKKSYPNARKKNRSRNWKLKNMVKEEDLAAMGGRGQAERAKQELDYQRFLDDLEEDPELRGMINLYKGLCGVGFRWIFSGLIRLIEIPLDPNGRPVPRRDENAMSEDEEEPEEDFPQIQIDELLDDMEQMHIGDEDGDEVMG